MGTKVIPANAGVILKKMNMDLSKIGYPRECGGDPIELTQEEKATVLSPRMRG